MGDILDDNIIPRLDHFTPIIEFVKTYPDFGNVMLFDITPIMFPPFARENTNSLGISGGNNIGEIIDVIGDSLLRIQYNYQLFMRRSFNDPSFFHPEGMFIQNLMLWINLRNKQRNKRNEHPLLPKYLYVDGEKVENILITSLTADGGIVWQQVPEMQGVFDLTLQIHEIVEIEIKSGTQIPD